MLVTTECIRWQHRDTFSKIFYSSQNILKSSHHQNYVFFQEEYKQVFNLVSCGCFLSLSLKKKHSVNLNGEM